MYYNFDETYFAAQNYLCHSGLNRRKPRFFNHLAKTFQPCYNASWCNNCHLTVSFYILPANIILDFLLGCLFLLSTVKSEVELFILDQYHEPSLFASFVAE